MSLRPLHTEGKSAYSSTGKMGDLLEKLWKPGFEAERRIVGRVLFAHEKLFPQ